jgi:flagellar motor switch/type III secretory pathway protein FliN
VHVDVSSDDDLWLAVAQHVEWRPPRPFNHVPVRVRFELGTTQINVDDVALVQFCE